MPQAKVKSVRGAKMRKAPSNDPIVLVTGFGPHAGAEENPADAAVKGLHGFRVAGARVQAVILPSAYGAAARRLKASLRRLDPCAVVCFAAGPSGPFLLERTARNRDDDPRPDATRKVHRGVPIDRKAPAEVPSTLPLDVIRARLSAADIPSMASDNAGGYLGNHAFFQLMQAMPADRGVAGLIRMPVPSPKTDLAGKARLRLQAATAVRLIVGAAAERGVMFRAAAQALTPDGKGALPAVPKRR